jgi:opacity protein-like surface antigen
MKKLLLAAALAAVAVSPAFAAKNHRTTANDPANQTYASAPPNSDIVIDNGRVIGTDPDPFIRGQLQREGDQTQSNGQ